MNLYKVEQIKNAAQGLCGLLDVLFEVSVLESVGCNDGDMSPDTFCKLLQSAKVLATQLNANTESLEDHVLIK